jgi:hypothetical protein
LNDLSSLFGYQLAGAILTNNKLYGTCSKIVDQGLDKLSKIGIVPAQVQGQPEIEWKFATPYLCWSASQAPQCNTSTALPDADYARINAIYYNTKIFRTQLLNAFNSAEHFATLCNNLSLDRIDQFPLIGETVLDAVCNASSMQRTPEPEADPLPANPAALRAATISASALYAVLNSIEADSATDLTDKCKQAREQIDVMDNVLLNGSIIAETVCKITEPIALPVARELVRSWMTKYFVTVLENISNASWFRSWLCENLDLEKMDKAGLHGVAVQRQMCNNSNNLQASWDLLVKTRGSHEGATIFSLEYTMSYLLGGT